MRAPLSWSSKLTGIIENQRQRAYSCSKIGLNTHILGVGRNQQIKFKMAGFLNPRSINGLGNYLNSRNLIITLNHGLTPGFRQLEHFIYQTSDTISILGYLAFYFLTHSLVELGFRHGEHLCETRKNVERCTDFVRNLLYEITLHTRQLLCTLIGNLKFVVSLLQTNRRTMMEIDEETKDNDDNYQCQDIVKPHFLLLARNQKQ